MELRLPVEGDRTGQVPLLVLGGVYVNFDETLVGIVEVSERPFCGNEYIGHELFSLFCLLANKHYVLAKVKIPLTGAVQRQFIELAAILG